MMFKTGKEPPSRVAHSKMQHAMCEFTLSPADTSNISFSGRFLVFCSAWTTVLWLGVAPFIDATLTAAGISLLFFLAYWLKVIWRVNRWSLRGSQLVREAYLREFNFSSSPGYTLPHLRHWVVIPNYCEDPALLRATISALSLQTVGPESIVLVFAMEAAESNAVAKARLLAHDFPQFGGFVIHLHTLAPGETAGKSANVAAAFRAIAAKAKHAGNDPDLNHLGVCKSDCRGIADIPEVDNSTIWQGSFVDKNLITIMDADSLLHPMYLHAVEQSYHHERHSDRFEAIWQAPICNYMNFYSLPALTRISSLAVSLFELAALSHPTQRKLPFSTYTLSIALALKTNGWATDVIAEDWHMFLRAFVSTNGQAKVVPILLPVLCYSVEDPESWILSLKARCAQAVRHSWGVIEVSSLVTALRHPGVNISLSSAAALLNRMFMVHFIGIIQLPAVLAVNVIQWKYSLKEFSPFSVPTTSVPNFLSWLMLVAISLSFFVMSLSVAFTALAHFRYENVLRTIYADAYQRVKRDDRISYNIAKHLELPPLPHRIRQIFLLIELLILFPVSGLFLFFLPELYCQTVQLWRRQIAYKVAAKPILTTVVGH